MEETKTAKDSKEILAELRGFTGILPEKFVFATPPIFKEAYPKEPEKWPVYKFKPSDGKDFNDDVDNPNIYRWENGRAIPYSGKFRVHKIKRGLKGAKNHRAGDTEIPFTTDADGNVSDDFIRSLKPDLQNWMLGVISDSEAVSEEESEALKF